MKLELIPVVRYWEYSPRELSAALDRLSSQGATTVGAWVPWMHLETDRQHLLQKFVKQAVALGLRVRLGVTPELGTGFPSAGIPEDLLEDRGNWAQDRTGEPIFACSPPNIHPLVSLTAPSVFQRYGHFLLKFVQELQDVLPEQTQQPVSLVVTDSLFKHYRNTGLPLEDHGDYSMRYAQPEGGRSAWNPAAAERLFQNRAVDFLHSRFARHREIKVERGNVCTRSASLDRLAEELFASGVNLPQFFRDLQRSAAHCSLLWLDDVQALSGRERQFLISAGVVCFDEVWLGEEDYLATKESFRARIHRLVKTYQVPEATRHRPALALVENRFAPAKFALALQDKLGFSLRMRGSALDINPEELASLRFIVAEEALRLEFTQSKELLRLAQDEGKTVVLFRSSLCDRAAQTIASHRSFQIRHGWDYEICLFAGGGQLLIVQGGGDTAGDMHSLAQSLIGVAKLEPWCTYLKEDICTLRVDWQGGAETARSLFLLNPRPEAKSLHLEFHMPVRLGEGEGEDFTAELPPYAAIPLQVTVLEKREAPVAAMMGAGAELADEPVLPTNLENEGIQDGTQAELA